MRLRVIGHVIALVLGLGACWRNAPPPREPQLSFVARVNALAELRTRTDALEPRLERALHRIVGLASEAERAAIQDDLIALDADVVRLSRIATAARERGEDVGEIERKLELAALGVMNLREELLHAKTRVEQEAFEELKRKLEGTLDPGDIRMRIYRRDPFAPRPVPDTILP